MKHELAKELKDSGFPQGGVCATTVTFEKEVIKLPTLEELIEACGAGFDELRRNPNHRPACYEAIEEGQNYCEGKTPTEAVARLWLALNKK